MNLWHFSVQTVKIIKYNCSIYMQYVPFHCAPFHSMCSVFHTMLFHIHAVCSVPLCSVPFHVFRVPYYVVPYTCSMFRSIMLRSIPCVPYYVVPYTCSMFRSCVLRSIPCVPCSKLCCSIHMQFVLFHCAPFHSSCSVFQPMLFHTHAVCSVPLCSVPFHVFRVLDNKYVKCSVPFHSVPFCSVFSNDPN